ncbi:NAD-dependent succinate-semialdehyde dehydrogenase [Fodinicurvata halophila]|uniref:NAD-dependent succinate-semialdehyde dehydrogenase n=1 Tax=Fodinicurvata halophila TaxID=1419723 RepID=A0ABV8UKI7_9PROT
MLTQEKFHQTSVLPLLRDARLFREQAYIAGKWCSASNGRVLPVTNPADQSYIGSIPDMRENEAHQAVEAAQSAFADWKARLPQERGAILQRWYELMCENKEDLAILMTLEQGKPLAESRGEIDYAASFLQWYAEETRRINVETVTPHLPDCDMELRRQPVGVVAAVTPWNFPSAMITRKAAAAIAAGCPVVVRPASETPFSALALAELGERAGLPAGLFSVVTGDPEAIVGEFNRNPKVRALSFTGSTEVGRKLLAQGAATVKRMSMELGGHAPFILFPDVPMEEAVSGALSAKFATTGQDCLAANRIYVHQDIYEPFLKAYGDAVAAQAVGNGLEADVDLGPLMSEKAIAKCQEHVDDAVAKGARLLTGGRVHECGELFYEPTLLADVTPEMKIYQQETFGPVAAVCPFATEDEVVQRANDTEYGLAAYLYTRDHARVKRVTSQLEYGMVAVNRVKMTGAPIPFGGMKQSGLGREGSRHGLEEFTEIQYVCSSH